ncbi:MAG TPA: protein kinase [Holophagaceae bacterium]|nr:protein kinase [Holophagaceae bacterium]
MFDKLGKFEIKRLLGHGAMGEVYLGVDPSIGREVAIKTILAATAGGEEAKARFAREAKAAGVLNHPNLVTIYEFGEDQGVLYIAMEFVKGHDLEELLRDQSLTRSELLEVLAQVCDGLDFAHHGGIVHRDIKPSNVRVIRDGRRLAAKVMDFGVARVGNSDMTATGMVMGTVSYMAPEYIRSGKPDPRSDLFAVGVMLYEALSGRKPFAGDTTPTILYKIVNEAPEPLDTDALQGISPATRSVLERALVKDPDQRYQTAADFAKALRAAKDPTWGGQFEEGTTLLKSGAAPAPSPAFTPSSAPTVIARPEAATSALTVGTPVGDPTLATSAAAPTVAPAAPTRGSRTGLLLGAAAAVVLLAIAGGAGWWWTHRGEAPQELALGPGSGSSVAGPQQAEAPGTSRPAAGPRTSGPALPAGKDAGTLQANGLQTPGGQTGSQASSQTNGAFAAPAPAPPQLTPAERRKQEQDQSADPARYTSDKLDQMEAPQRMNVGNLTLSDGIRLADSEPAKAIAILRNAIAADPTKPNAYAWLAVVYYNQGRYGEFNQTIRMAENRGISRDEMAQANARFRICLNNARLSNRLN